MSMLCVPRHGSWFFLLVCHAHGALPARFQQKYMFMVEFLYCAGRGTWSLTFDAFCWPVREFAWSCL